MTKGKVICIVLNNFKTDNRVLKEANHINKLGFDTTIIALHEAELKEHDFTNENTRIHRIKLTSKNWKKNRLIHFFKYIEFLGRVLFHYKKSDIVHCHDLNTLPIGCMIKLLSFGKTRLIYDTHEFASNDTPYESVLNQKIKWFLENFFIKFADEIITVNKAIADLYKTLYKLKKNPFVIHNCPHKTLIPKSNILKEKLGIPNDRYLIIYQGILSKGRNIKKLINFMNDTKIDNLAIVFMGYGELEEEVKNAANEQIFYHPAVPPIDLLNYTASADCGISLIADSCISYRYCTPNKLFEYSMAGLPVITSDLPEQARLVKKYKIGEVPESDRSSDLTAAILTIMKIKSFELKENLANFTNKYNWENQSLELTKVYEKN